jgi:hypothetical protein
VVSSKGELDSYLPEKLIPVKYTSRQDCNIFHFPAINGSDTPLPLVKNQEVSGTTEVVPQNNIVNNLPKQQLPAEQMQTEILHSANGTTISTKETGESK